MIKMMRFYIAILFLGLFSCKSPKEEASDYLLDTTSKIVVMSYPERISWDKRKTKNIIENNKILFDTTMVIDKVQLEKEDVKTFIDILNKEFISPNGVDQISSCYLPRHLAVFYDEKNNIIAYLESCFNCGTTKNSENLEIFYGFDLEKLKEFYKKKNIKYFVDSDNDEKKELKYIDSIKSTNNKILK